jgi:hypothetical protein
MRLQLLKEEFSIDQLKKIKEFQKESFVRYYFKESLKIQQIIYCN